MSKIIIENRSDLDDNSVLKMVQRVVERGRISNDGKQYCLYATLDIDGVRYGISSLLQKHSDKFIITGDVK